MERIRFADIKPGYVVPSDLYSGHGIKLLGRQTQLTAEIVEYLGQIGTEFFLSESAEEFTQLSILRRIDTGALSRDRQPADDLIGLGGRVTGPRNEVLEQHHIDALKHGAFASLANESVPTARARRDLWDQVLSHRCAIWESLKHEVPIGDAEVRFCHDDRGVELLQSAPNLIAWREEKIELIRQQYTRLLAGLSLHWSLFTDLVDELIDLLERDPIRYPQIALSCSRTVDYLPDHALNTSTLAIALAARRHWPIEFVHQAGLAGLMHDVGMLLLPQRLRLEAEPLTQDDCARIRKHPAYSVSLLSETTQIPENVMCAIYRHHERDNGKGYPEKRKARKIGDLARLLAVADMAAAMNEPRPYRPRPLSHEAIQTLVQYGVDNVIHRPLIRSLVESVGLYPVGSYVRLSTDEIAQVVGMNPTAVDRPIVAICDVSGRPAQTPTDLSAHEPWELSILDGIAPPAELPVEELWQPRRAG